MSALEELIELSKSLENRYTDEWKKKGKKIVGYYCAYIPEEMLWAAGILPYRLRAPGCTGTTEADVHMSSINCSYVRSSLQFILEGKFDFLDGLVVGNSCDHIRRQFDVIKSVNSYPFLYLINVPHKSADPSIEYYKGDLLEYKEELEKHFGVKITDDKLRQAIELYNETRSLLQEVNASRKGDKPKLTGAEALSVIVAGGTMPRDKYNELLKKLLKELDQREGVSDYKARLMVAGGGGCDDSAYMQIMEDLGGLVVTDSICFGSRYFAEPIEIGDDVWLSLAKGYLNRPSCVKMLDQVAERDDYNLKMVKDFNVDGVVYPVLRYCQMWGGQQMQMRKTFGDAKVPVLTLEREYMIGATGQLKTRIQAFLERLEG